MQEQTDMQEQSGSMEDRNMTASSDGAPGGTMTVKASEFKAKCLKLMDEVAETGKEIVITKNGRPVSRLIPHHERPETLFGIDKGKLEIVGDITEPIDVEWKAHSGRGWELG